jgi:diacylglycerol kinase
MQGFRTAVYRERNIKVMLAGFVFAIAMGLFLELSVTSWAIVLLCSGTVLAAELLNTAIENVVDLVSPEYHPLAGRAKDIAASAVWTLCVLVAFVGCILFVDAAITKFGW